MRGFQLRAAQAAVLASVLVFWFVMTEPGLVPSFYFSNPNQAAFFFGQPLKVFEVILEWFVSGSIYKHLGITLFETVMAFMIGTGAGMGMGLWLALSPTAAAILDPYVKALNSMPRVILAPIFAVWFGLGVWSKVALGVTLVFFYRVFQCLPRRTRGKPDVTCQCTNARCGANRPATLCLFAQRYELGILEPAYKRWAGLRGRCRWRVLGLGCRGRLSDSASRGYV